MDYNGYRFEVSIENKELDVTPQKIQFSIKDSIHELYPQSILSFLDPYGAIYEYGIILEGSTIDMKYEFQKETINCPFGVESDRTKELSTANFISGQLEFKLKHDYWWDEQIESKAYTNKKISEVITSIFSGYNFFNTTIRETGNKLTWYRPLMREEKFINQILLPNAYSSEQNKTPFFCFINCNNELNFITYDEMINQIPIDTIIFEPENSLGIANNALVLHKFTTGNTINNNLYYRKNFEIDYSDGSLSETNETFLDFPKSFPNEAESPPKQVPIKDREILYKGYELYETTDNIKGKIDNNLGRQIYLQKNGFFTDRMRITVPLNLKLKSGKAINIDFFKAENRQKSIRFNGIYIIEECEHIWNGQNGLTIINIGRKNIKIPRAYDGFPNVWGRL